MEKSIGTLVPQLTVTGAYSFLGEIREVIFELRWMLALIVIMITADFILGIIDSISKRGEDFHFSRAGRRTACKFIEYNSYLVVGFALGIAVFEPLGICSYITSSVFGLCLAALFELDSIVEHICAIHGIENRISVKRLLVGIIKKKYAAAGDILEDAAEDTGKKQRNKEE